MFSVTSLMQQITELDRASELRDATLECYANAVQTAAQYAVEVERPLVEAHRNNMEAVRQQILNTKDAEGLQASKSALRAELRDYRDRAERNLNALRQEFQSALISLQEVMSSASDSENDHARELTAQLQSLRQLAISANLEHLRQGVNEAVNSIAGHLEKLRCQMDLTVAQFRDEIRVLQRRIHDVEASTAVDPETGALNRKEIETRIRKHVLTKGQASILIIKLRNLTEIERLSGNEMTIEVTATVCKRLRVSVGEEAEIGRWRPDTFVVRTAANKTDAMRLSNDLSRKLSGTYVCMQAGRPLRINVQTVIGVIDCNAVEDPDPFLARVEELSHLLR